MSQHEKAPPGCEPAGGGVYAITDLDAFLDAIRPAVEAGLAHVRDAEAQRSGEGWSGRMTCEACPVQIEGEVDGLPFYFRARWESWSFTVAAQPGGNAISGPLAFGLTGEAEDVGGMAGSWMPHSEVWRHIEEGIAALRAQRPKADA